MTLKFDEFDFSENFAGFRRYGSKQQLNKCRIVSDSVVTH